MIVEYGALILGLFICGSDQLLPSKLRFKQGNRGRFLKGNDAIVPFYSM